MWHKRRISGKVTGGVLGVVLLVLSAATVVLAIIWMVRRIKSLTREVDRLETELIEAKMQASENGHKNELEKALHRTPAKAHPKPEWSPAEREAINALALVRAVCDVASDRRFFTSYDLWELYILVMKIESDLRKIIQQRPPFNEPTKYWRLEDDEQFKKCRSAYREEIMKSIRKHSLQ